MLPVDGFDAGGGDGLEIRAQAGNHRRFGCGDAGGAIQEQAGMFTSLGQGEDGDIAEAAKGFINM